jgi:hypothetical protein
VAALSASRLAAIVILLTIACHLGSPLAYVTLAAGWFAARLWR